MNILIGAHNLGQSNGESLDITHIQARQGDAAIAQHVDVIVSLELGDSVRGDASVAEHSSLLDDVLPRALDVVLHHHVVQRLTDSVQSMSHRAALVLPLHSSSFISQN